MYKLNTKRTKSTLLTSSVSGGTSECWRREGWTALTYIILVHTIHAVNHFATGSYGLYHVSTGWQTKVYFKRLW